MTTIREAMQGVISGHTADPVLTEGILDELLVAIAPILGEVQEKLFISLNSARERTFTRWP